MSNFGRYRKRPVEVEATRFYDCNQGDTIAKWCDGTFFQLKGFDGTPVSCYIDIKTLEGTMRATLGDWIIKGTAGEFYPCKHDVFVEVYEPADGF